MMHPQSDSRDTGDNGGTPIVWEPIPGSSQQLAVDNRAHHILFTGARGPGKALPVNTPVPTPEGWKLHGLLWPGDYVFGKDGKPTKVLATFLRPQRHTFTVAFDDGTSIVADGDHLWNFTTVGTRSRNRVETTHQLAGRLENGQTVLLPTCSAIEFKQDAVLPIDPYLLGLLLGDGSQTNKRSMYCTVDNELAEYVMQHGFKEWATDSRNGLRTFGASNMIPVLRNLGIDEKRSHEKSIPDIYLVADTKSRLALLQGLMDTDGSASSNSTIEFCSVSPQLANNVAYLVRSLGGKATVKASASYLRGVQHRDRYRVYIQPANKFECFRLTRKQNKVQKYMHSRISKRIVSISFHSIQDCNCIAVEANDNLYIAGENFVVTHNTDTQLMRFRRFVSLGYGSFWRGVIFDREYKNLDDLISKSKRWFYAFKDGAKFLSSPSDLKWVWPTGEELLFRQAKKLDDYYNYHGQEFPFIGWNELTKYPTSELYDRMTSVNRSSFVPANYPQKDNEGKTYLLPEMPLEVFSTTNPYGPGHAWVKRKFIDPAPYGNVIRNEVNVFNPRTQQEEVVTKMQVTIFGSYRENIYLSPQYIADLESISDENMRQAWLFGNWDIVAGGALDDVWRRAIHVIKQFKIPHSWRIDRALDWGSTHPCSVGWFAEANGEEATMADGSSFCPPAGTIIQFDELYLTKGIGTNKGLKLSAKDIALRIKAKEIELLASGTIKTQPRPGPADNQIRDVRESDVDTIEKKMADQGIRWVESDKSPGSRKNGLQLIRDALEASTRGEGPGLYFTSNCVASTSTLPTLPRDDTKMDDVDTDAEDHPYDMVRYRVLRGSNRYATKISVKLWG